MRNTPFVKPAGFRKRPCRFIAKPLVSQKWHGLPQGAAVPLRTNYSFRDSSLLHDREHGNAHARCCFGIHSRGAGTLALYLFSQLHLHPLLRHRYARVRIVASKTSESVIGRKDQPRGCGGSIAWSGWCTSREPSGARVASSRWCTSAPRCQQLFVTHRSSLKCRLQAELCFLMKNVWF